jgi:hypothetical protein
VPRGQRGGSPKAVNTLCVNVNTGGPCTFRRPGRFLNCCANFRYEVCTCVPFVTRHISPISGCSLPSGVAVITVVGILEVRGEGGCPAAHACAARGRLRLGPVACPPKSPNFTLTLHTHSLVRLCPALGRCPTRTADHRSSISGPRLSARSVVL